MEVKLVKFVGQGHGRETYFTRPSYKLSLVFFSLSLSRLNKHFGLRRLTPPYPTLQKTPKRQRRVEKVGGGQCPADY